LLPLAASNFFGPVLLAPLFDTVGRCKMIVGTYAAAGVLLLVTATLLSVDAFTAWTQTIAWMAVFFFADLGWRFGFAIGGLLGLGIILLRGYVPESPRWLVTHGWEQQADASMSDIEQRVRSETGLDLAPAQNYLERYPQKSFGLGLILRAMVQKYRERTMLALALMTAQAFLFNDVRVEKHQRGPGAGGRSEPEASIHHKVDPAAIFCGNELVGGRINRGIFAADPHTRDRPECREAPEIPGHGGWLTDRFGRRFVFYVTLIVYLTGVLLTDERAAHRADHIGGGGRADLLR
jgi:MFS family permease